MTVKTTNASRLAEDSAIMLGRTKAEECTYAEFSAASKIAETIGRRATKTEDAVKIINFCRLQAGEQPICYMKDLKKEGRKYDAEMFENGADYYCCGHTYGKFNTERKFFVVAGEREREIYLSDAEREYAVVPGIYAISFNTIDEYIGEAAARLVCGHDYLPKSVDISEDLRMNINMIICRARNNAIFIKTDEIKA